MAMLYIRATTDLDEGPKQRCSNRRDPTDDDSRAGRGRTAIVGWQPATSYRPPRVDVQQVPRSGANDRRGQRPGLRIVVDSVLAQVFSARGPLCCIQGWLRQQGADVSARRAAAALLPLGEAM